MLHRHPNGAGMGYLSYNIIPSFYIDGSNIYAQGSGTYADPFRV
jgi:hypothetical protein